MCIHKLHIFIQLDFQELQGTYNGVTVAEKTTWPVQEMGS